MVRFAGEIPADFRATWRDLGTEEVTEQGNIVLFEGDNVNEPGGIAINSMTPAQAKQFNDWRMDRPEREIIIGPEVIIPPEWFA